ncbi:MAG: AraC family transcriptional regulator [Anaerotruncus sp.]|nr:MAG: AraC family transcriptional regulator [Anaerotruncus sp.]
MPTPANHLRQTEWWTIFALSSRKRFFSKITVDTVSAFFNISPRRLHQIFTNELGISPKQYILKKKMEEGYRLLVETSMPINKISETLCFSSPYHFTNEFKKSIFRRRPLRCVIWSKTKKTKSKNKIVIHNLL